MRAALVLTVVVLASMVLMRLKTLPHNATQEQPAFQRLRRHLDLQSPKTAPVSVAEFRGNPP